MGYEDERAAIEAKFTTGWAGATPIAYENVKYTPVAGTAFVSLDIVPAGSNQITLGDSPLYRHGGAISIGIYTPKWQGTKIAKDYADAAAAIFRNANAFSGILCRAPYMDVVGEKDGWYKINVIVPFQRDEIF